MMKMETISMMDKPFIIFDGNNTAYRSAAVISLTNVAGQSVAVPFGVIRSVRFIIERFQPRDIAVVWDGGRHPLRKDLLPEYKRSDRRRRSKEQFEDKDVYGTIKIAQRLLKLLGIPQYQFEHNEADDIIAKIVDNIDDNVLIISSDKDFWQLLSNNISVYNPIKDLVYTPQNFMQNTELLLTPEQYLEYHILLGDSSDNIPGVPGVGKKTVLHLISTYKSVEGAMKAVAESPGIFSNRARKILLGSSIQQLHINRELIDLRRFASNIKIGDNLLKGNPKVNYKRFKEVISGKRLVFNSILNELNYWLMPFRKLSVRRKRDACTTLEL